MRNAAVPCSGVVRTGEKKGNYSEPALALTTAPLH